MSSWWWRASVLGGVAPYPYLSLGFQNTLWGGMTGPPKHPNSYRSNTETSGGTVDGRNPAPLITWVIPLFTWFYRSQVVVWNFFHQQYDWKISAFVPNLAACNAFFATNQPTSSLMSGSEAWWPWPRCGPFPTDGGGGFWRFQGEVISSGGEKGQTAPPTHNTERFWDWEFKQHQVLVAPSFGGDVDVFFFPPDVIFWFVHCPIKRRL